jgi:hypothetical protein
VSKIQCFCLISVVYQYLVPVPYLFPGVSKIHCFCVTFQYQYRIYSRGVCLKFTARKKKTPPETSACACTMDVGRPPLPHSQAIDPDELDQRRQGTYFSFYGSFWNVQSTQIPLNEADALGSIRRERMPKMYEEQAFSTERLCKDLARSQIEGRTENSSSETSISNAGAETDLLGHRLYQKAHLISDAKVGSKCYGFIAAAALGLSNSSADAETRLELVNGVQHEVGNQGKIERVKQSGMKHNKYNKLRFFLQKEALDNFPFLLIIPILPLEAVLDWDETDLGKDYSYDVMICAHASQRAEAIYAELFQNHEGSDSECTPQDIQTATELLSTFARAIATSTFNDSIMESMTAVNTTRSRSVANVIGRINRARADQSAAVGLPFINPTVVNLENAAAMATQGVRVVKARVSKRT